MLYYKYKEFNMSEYINNSSERSDALFSLYKGYIEKEDGRELWDRYKHKLDGLTPLDVLLMGDKLMQEGYTQEQITYQVEKIFNIIIPILKEYDWDELEEDEAEYGIFQIRKKGFLPAHPPL